MTTSFRLLLSLTTAVCQNVKMPVNTAHSLNWSANQQAGSCSEELGKFWLDVLQTFDFSGNSNYITTELGFDRVIITVRWGREINRDTEYILLSICLTVLWDQRPRWMYALYRVSFRLWLHYSKTSDTNHRPQEPAMLSLLTASQRCIQL